MDAVGIVESISPVDRSTARLAEWANLGSKELVEPQGMPYEVWVGGTRVQDPRMPNLGMEAARTRTTKGAVPLPVGRTYSMWSITQATR